MLVLKYITLLLFYLCRKFHEMESFRQPKSPCFLLSLVSVSVYTFHIKIWWAWTCSSFAINACPVSNMKPLTPTFNVPNIQDNTFPNILFQNYCPPVKIGDDKLLNIMKDLTNITQVSLPDHVYISPSLTGNIYITHPCIGQELMPYLRVLLQVE